MGYSEGCRLRDGRREMVLSLMVLMALPLTVGADSEPPRFPPIDVEVKGRSQADIVAATITGVMLLLCIFHIVYHVWSNRRTNQYENELPATVTPTMEPTTEPKTEVLGPISAGGNITINLGGHLGGHRESQLQPSVATEPIAQPQTSGANQPVPQALTSGIKDEKNAKNNDKPKRKGL